MGEFVVAGSWAVPPSAALKRRPANSEITIDRPTGFDIKPSLWPVPFPVPRWNQGRFTSLVAGKSRSTSSFHVHTVGRMEERAGALQPAAEAVRAGPVPTRRDTAYRVARPQDTRGQGDPAGRGYAIRYSPILLAAPRMIFSLDAKPASPPVSHLAPFDSRRHAHAGQPRPAPRLPSIWQLDPRDFTKFCCIFWKWPRSSVDLKPDPESNPRVEDEPVNAAEVNVSEPPVMSC